jgi:hypothetical protein
MIEENRSVINVSGTLQEVNRETTKSFGKFDVSYVLEVKVIMTKGK